MRQYIGARYVPKYFENSATNDSTWASGTSYESLTVVYWNGNYYTSKKPVPASVGAPNLNPDYWVLTGSYNSAIENINSRLDGIDIDIDAIEDDIDNLEDDTTLLKSIAHRNFILIGDSYSIGVTTDDGTTYRNVGGWATRAKSFLEGKGCTAYVSELVAPGTTGFASTVTFESMLRHVVTNQGADPDEITDIIVLGGTNDKSYAANVPTAIASFMSYCNSTFKNARVAIGVLGTDTYGLKNTGVYSAYRGCVSSGAQFLGDLYNLFGNPQYICPDNVHLTETGYGYYQNEILECILWGKTDYKLLEYHDLTIGSKFLQNGNPPRFAVIRTPKGYIFNFSGTAAQFPQVKSDEAITSTNLNESVLYNMTTGLRISSETARIYTRPMYGQASGGQNYVVTDVIIYITSSTVNVLITNPVGAVDTALHWFTLVGVPVYIEIE